MTQDTLLDSKFGRIKIMHCVRPLWAIRFKCYDCSGWNWAEVEKCSHQDCILWPLRFGKKPKGMQYKHFSAKEYSQAIEKGKY
jgi:hypothetical protein